MKKQLNCEELGTNIKFDKHQVGQTLIGTKIELEKKQVGKTSSKTNTKQWMGQTLNGKTLSGKSIKWDKQ